MKVEIPPVGLQLAFAEWTRVLTVRLREYIPGVSAAAQGPARVVWRYGGSEVLAVDHGGTYWVRFGSASIYDRDRHDAFTAGNCAKTIAGHLDARCSTPD